MSANARAANLSRRDAIDRLLNALLNEPAEVAALALDCPIAIVSPVGKDRVWLKASRGIDGLDQLARDEGLCGSAVMQDDPRGECAGRRAHVGRSAGRGRFRPALFTPARHSRDRTA